MHRVKFSRSATVVSIYNVSFKKNKSKKGNTPNKSNAQIIVLQLYFKNYEAQTHTYL